MKKKIGISVSEINFEPYKIWFSGLGPEDDIELVELSFKEGHPEAIAGCDGLVLTGGIDICPVEYGIPERSYPHAPKTFSPERDYYEIELFRLAQENHLPVLGICRGMQLINTICNGTLVLDLGDGHLNQIHKGSPDKSHHLTIIPGTLLEEIADEHAGVVNSAHHQAICEIGEGLMINCQAADGIIEGIEWTDKNGKPFMLAVQWHPERMPDKEENPLSKNIRDRFIAEVIKNG